MSEKKLTIVQNFTVFDLISAHAREYKGVTCRAWHEDLESLLESFDLNYTIPGLGALRLNSRPELRAHLLKWGFVKEEDTSWQIKHCAVTEREENVWCVSVTLNDGAHWDICDIMPNGLKRHKLHLSKGTKTPFDVTDDLIALER